jgi:hypothetical protein
MSDTTYPARGWPENQPSKTPEADGEGKGLEVQPRASYALSLWFRQ